MGAKGYEYFHAATHSLRRFQMAFDYQVNIISLPAPGVEAAEVDGIRSL